MIDLIDDVFTVIVTVLITIAVVGVGFFIIELILPVILIILGLVGWKTFFGT